MEHCSIRIKDTHQTWKYFESKWMSPKRVKMVANEQLIAKVILKPKFCLKKALTSCMEIHLKIQWGGNTISRRWYKQNEIGWRIQFMHFRFPAITHTHTNRNWISTNFRPVWKTNVRKRRTFIALLSTPKSGKHAIIKQLIQKYIAYKEKCCTPNQSKRCSLSPNETPCILLEWYTDIELYGDFLLEIPSWSKLRFDVIRQTIKLHKNTVQVKK